MIRRISDANEDFQRNDARVLPNNAVAQTDLKAAIRAISDTFQEEIDRSVDNPTQSALFQDLQESLLRHIQRIVEPVADADFQDYVDSYHVTPVDNHAVDIENEETNATPDAEENIYEEQKEQEIDEDDLLDIKALQEAQHLREKVRALAAGVQEIREQVLKDSLDLTVAKDYQTLMRAIKSPRAVEDVNGSEVEEQMIALEESLGALSDFLQDSQWNSLPQQLQTLQNTIEVIQKESSKERTPTQTEGAIISRSNSGAEEDNEMVDVAQLLSHEEEVQLTAEDRFARFFEQLA